MKSYLKDLGITSKHPIYLAWVNMKTRCDNPNSTQWKWYGARGIHYCEDWAEFKNFHRDMAGTWEEGLTLERENNNLGYSPDNCCWSTPKEQCNNRRVRVDSLSRRT